LTFLAGLKLGRILSQSDPNGVIDQVGDGTISRGGAKAQSLVYVGVIVAGLVPAPQISEIKTGNK
jgi:hypothetical protein